MKISLPVYVVALVVSFVYGLLKGYFPDLPFSEEQIRWLFEGLLALLGVDVVNALKSGGYFQ